MRTRKHTQLRDLSLFYFFWGLNDNGILGIKQSANYDLAGHQVLLPQQDEVSISRVPHHTNFNFHVTLEQLQLR